MATLSVSAVRQRVATAIDTALSASGWRQGTGTIDTFGAAESDSRLHKGYAVGCPSSHPAGKLQRQRLPEGVLSSTEVRVRWAYQIAALDQVTSYDAALDAEAALVVAVMAQQQSADLHLVYDRAVRTVDDQGWMNGTLTFWALHQLPLA